MYIHIHIYILNMYVYVFKNKLAQPGLVVHVYNPSTKEAEVGGSWVQGQHGLQSKFKATLGYIARPCLKKQK
jgi:hypothetical protein